MFRCGIGGGYKFNGPKQGWWIVAAFSCLLFATASLAFVRFYPASSVTQFAESLAWVALAGAIVALFDWLRRNFIPSILRFLRSRFRTQAINKLYAELHILRNRAIEDRSLDGQVETRFSQLRKLQAEEAEEWVRESNAALLLKPEEALKALEQAKKLIEMYQDRLFNNEDYMI